MGPQLKFERFSALVSSGVSAADALRLSGVASEGEFEILKLAIEVGAPLKPTASALASYQESQRVFEREVNQAQAVPKATRKLMLWLPAFGIALGEILGFGSLSALSSTAGLIGFLVALALVYAGASITQRMLDRSMSQKPVPGSDWLRLQILLSAGAPLDAALKESGLARDQNDLTELALETGASLEQLISAQIREEFASFASRSIAVAKALAVKLLIPLGITTLPAFLIFTVLPMLIGITNK